MNEKRDALRLQKIKLQELQRTQGLIESLIMDAQNEIRRLQEEIFLEAFEKEEAVNVAITN